MFYTGLWELDGPTQLAESIQPVEPTQPAEITPEPRKECPETVQESQMVSTSAQQKRGRKVVLSNRSAQSRENKRLRERISALQRLIWRTQKRMQLKRPKSPVATPDLTPKSKLNKIIEPEKVRKELFKGLVLEHELKVDVAEIGHNMKKKTQFDNVITGRIIKKYRIKNQLKFLLNKSLNKNHLQSESSLFNRVTPESVIAKTKAIENFYRSDRASHLGPEKRSFVKINGERVRKRFLNDSLVSLHKVFSETSGMKVAFSTFCKYRPKEVVEPKICGRDTCLCKTSKCERCENFKLMCKALRASHILVEKKLPRFVRFYVLFRKDRKLPTSNLFRL